MRVLKSGIVSVLILLLAIQPAILWGEAIDDRFTETNNLRQADQGEFIHGQSYGKVLIRCLMFGAVPKQGVHFVPEGTDLLFAILYAGGYGEDAKLNGITIRRKNVTSIIRINLEDLIEEGRPVPKVADGDVITIPWSWRKDFSTITLITSFLTGITSLTLSLIALARTK